MARSFSASGDQVTVSPGALSTLPSGSFVFLLKAGTGPSIRILLSAAGAGFQAIYLNSAGVVNFQGATTVSSPTITLSPSDGYVLLGLTKASGTNVMRFHKYNFATGTFTHEDSSATVANPAGLISSIRIGNEGSGAQFGGDVAAGAIWSGTALSDGQFESLIFSTDSWLTLSPSAMWLFNQLSTGTAVTDVTGNGANQSALSGTTVATSVPPIFESGRITSGMAARNGTTSHTIPFGFTSTSGNMLVVLVYGGVTHAATGWTEELSPVSSGELSVFTKTSTGDSSITVTHNASNYPVDWVAYELPAGSTWTGGTSTNNTGSDTFPALTGLPGTAQLVIAARGRIAGSTAATSADTTWTAPFAEDADLFTAHNGSTDGATLAVAHATGVTSTSVTPSASTSVGGSWVVGDRQHVVFAIALGSGGGSTTTNGTASVTGAGTVTATGTQIIRATASVTGAGGVTAAATQRAGATVAGAGSVSATGSVRINGTATITGSGSVSATGTVRTNATATVTGSGSVSAAATQGGSASVAGVGSVIAGAGGVVNGTASVTGAGSVTAAARIQSGAAVTGAGSVTAAAVQSAAATVVGTGSVTAGAGGVVNGTANVTGTGSVSALATQRGAASVAGAGAVTAAGQVVRLGTASVVGTGSVTAAVRQLAGATVAGVGQVSATSAGQITYGTATVVGQGFVTANANSRITPRPYAGITSRPDRGITPRP